jgi:hypothetical protein
MNVIDLDRWEDFEPAVSRLEAEGAGYHAGRPFSFVSHVIYRGQANAEWLLETTLERYLGHPSTMLSYYKSVSAIRNYLQSFTGKSWDLKPWPELEAEISDLDGFGLTLPAYGLLVHLRHHGFPSPLLDWTRSPFAAAFFAFRSIASETKRVAIFAYREFAGDGKSGLSEDPTISSQGPYLTTHPRHFLQQAEYTVCIARPRDNPVFAPHGDVFAKPNPTQDLLCKFTLPASEAIRVRERLARYNITAHSLFGSEEALLETLADQELRTRAKS